MLDLGVGQGEPTTLFAHATSRGQALLICLDAHHLHHQQQQHHRVHRAQGEHLDSQYAEVLPVLTRRHSAQQPDGDRESKQPSTE